MALELRKNKKGKHRKHWYGRYEINGKRHCINLGILIQGTPPSSLRQIGDPAFERSKAQAQVKLDSIVQEARNKRNQIQVLEKIYEAKTGAFYQETTLQDLPNLWLQMPRSKRISETHGKQGCKRLTDFVKFVEARYKNVQHLSQVTKPIAHAYLKKESDRGIAPKTYNDILKLLRSAFSKILQGTPNPFEGIPSRKTETFYRKPFTQEELSRILETSKGHAFIRPIIILGISTAMRRGDCCLLRWNQVDLDDGFITVKTSKTGHTAEIPILPILREELIQAMPGKNSNGKPDDYVFPKQAEMYLNNPDGITWRVRTLLKKAGFAEDMRTDRPQGLRKASIRDFHSFRVTWITLALSAGIPLELVQRVTGHQTTEIVRKHYFQPNRENFRQAFYEKMPELMTKN